MGQDAVEGVVSVQNSNVRQVLDGKEDLEEWRVDLDGLGGVLQEVGYRQAHVPSLRLVAVNVHLVDVAAEDLTAVIQDRHAAVAGAFQYLQGFFQGSMFVDSRQVV